MPLPSQHAVPCCAVLHPAPARDTQSPNHTLPGSVAGDIDPFVKVPRPDGKADNLGLDNLDEPAAVQSDPNVLQLQLRAVSKSSAAQVMAVASVNAAEKDPQGDLALDLLDQ